MLCYIYTYVFNFLWITTKALLTWSESIDEWLVLFTWHSFISIIFFPLEGLLYQKSYWLSYLYSILMLFLSGILIDLFLYFLWKYLSKYVKTKFERKNLFYIFFRFVPIIWIFSVFIWALLSKEFNYKKDFIKIFIWNVLFIVVNVIFWGSMWQLCWRIMEGWFTF